MNRRVGTNRRAACWCWRCPARRRSRRRISREPGAPGIRKTFPSAFRAPTSATISACRSTRRRDSSPTAGIRRASRCRKSSAACTSLRTSIAVRSTSASGRSATRTRRSSSRSSTTSAPTTRRARSTWTAVRIRPRSPRTPGRASPPARWLGDMLVVDTTHIKQGWIRRNGLPMSDKATMTEFFVRNGDVLTRMWRAARSGVPHRAAREERGLRARRPQPAARRTSSTSAIRSSKSSGRKAWCRPISSARTRSTRSFRIGSTCPSSPSTAARKRCIPIHGQAEAGEVDDEDHHDARGRRRIGAGRRRLRTAGRRPGRAAPARAKPQRRTSMRCRCRCCTCRATSTCSPAPAATPPCRSATPACWSSTRSSPRLSDKLLAAIRTISPKPIHYIVNTHVHDDHIGGNAALAKAGPTRPERRADPSRSRRQCRARRPPSSRTRTCSTA